jgi:ABC-2 type transport system permease protein
MTMTMTVTPPAPPTTRLGKARWALADGFTVVGRHLMRLWRTPSELIGELIFPAAMVLLFGYVFGSAISVPGSDYREFLMPGLYVMTTLAGVMTTSVAVAGDAAKGVTDRFRSMPMARLAVPFGQTGADIFTGLITMSMMVLCGLAVGWRSHLGITRTLAAFGLLVFLRYAISWGGVLLGLSVREETADKLVPLMFPITMISNAFVPTERMTPWLRAVAEWNPVSAAVTASRHLFGNAQDPVHGELSWPIAHPITATLLWSVLLLIVFVPLAVRRYGTIKR